LISGGAVKQARWGVIPVIFWWFCYRAGSKNSQFP
jgi:hypothetical protein